MAYYRQTRFGLERMESKPLTPPKKRKRTTKAKEEPKQQAQAENKREE